MEPIVGFSLNDFSDPDPESPAFTMLDGARETSLSAEASGASKLRLRSFPTDEVHLVTSGAAKCEVAPQRFLSAEATGGSGIWYLSREGLVTELNIGRGATLSVSR